MKPLTQVIVTLVLVWGSILVYDRVRADEPAPTPKVEEAPEIEPPAEPEPPLPETVDDDVVDADAEPTEEEIERFLTVLEAAEAVRRERRAFDQMNRQLDRIGLDVTDELRATVIKMAILYRDRQRMLWRELPRGNDEASREARREVFDELRSDFQETLEMVLSAEDAEKVVTGLSGGSGFGGRGR